MSYKDHVNTLKLTSLKCDAAFILNVLGECTMSDVIIIEAGRHEINYWRDLWRYRELFYVLAWRDVAVRYKQTVIGVAWAVIRPFLTMVVFTIIFGRIAKLPSDGSAPYPLMVF